MESGQMSKSEELYQKYNPMSEKASMTDIAFDTGVIAERNRIINLLLELNAVRRCAVTDKLVAFDTDGKKVIYLTGVETE
jgi:hypothetical protein